MLNSTKGIDDGKMLSLEQKYIKLLEQKIAQLEKSLAAKDKLNGDSDAPSTDGVALDNTKRDSEESCDEKKASKESSDKVRYLLLNFRIILICS